mmetsp:Transcript_51949/g.113925  ORF Transcript_51949/g.113925 Transcript_51949/m.113925 type:complete len:215 (+) Transcript_51949:186-830(+)
MQRWKTPKRLLERSRTRTRKKRARRRRGGRTSRRSRRTLQSRHLSKTPRWRTRTHEKSIPVTGTRPGMTNRLSTKSSQRRIIPGTRQRLPLAHRLRLLQLLRRRLRHLLLGTTLLRRLLHQPPVVAGTIPGLTAATAMGTTESIPRISPSSAGPSRSTAAPEFANPIRIAVPVPERQTFDQTDRRSGGKAPPTGAQGGAQQLGVRQGGARSGGS